MQGGFSGVDLNKFVRSYGKIGAHELIAHLAMMQNQVLSSLRDNADEQAGISSVPETYFGYGEPVVVVETGENFDFGYISGTGKAVVYSPGERNMQDSVAIDLSLLVRKIVYDTTAGK